MTAAKLHVVAPEQDQPAPDRGKPCAHCGTATVRRKRESRRRFAWRQFCSLRCVGQAKVADRTERFWRRVTMGSESECWLWTDRRCPRGYGIFAVLGKAYRAHRFALMSVGTSVPDDMVVMHTCDNPPCCNPSHLRVGTIAENNRDCAAKGRNSEQRKTHCPRGHEYSPANTRMQKSRSGLCRVCRVCERIRHSRSAREAA
jgi:hypothetical protein